MTAAKPAQAILEIFIILPFFKSVFGSIMIVPEGGD